MLVTDDRLSILPSSDLPPFSSPSELPSSSPSPLSLFDAIEGAEASVTLASPPRGKAEEGKPGAEEGRRPAAAACLIHVFTRPTIQSFLTLCCFFSAGASPCSFSFSDGSRLPPSVRLLRCNSCCGNNDNRGSSDDCSEEEEEEEAPPPPPPSTLFSLLLSCAFDSSAKGKMAY